ncbi:hypothetical protein [Rhodoplanes serenus]|uniref:hypothetical protein n=1 Tax=Rhodoplanes serenus TaxID=200615 RepID=UPI000DAC66D8|nr:hypothetical protein [Rhodoplanes serenus]RAI34101.1 hypothetical protein CH340_10105 [Rhodoplanes serenus]
MPPSKQRPENRAEARPEAGSREAAASKLGGSKLGASKMGAPKDLPKDRLPRRFPVGTRFVVEGEPDRHGILRIVSRTVVMPSGRRYDLPAQPGGEPSGRPPPASGGLRRRAASRQG